MSDNGNAFVIDCDKGACVFVHEVNGALRFRITASDGKNLGWFAVEESTVRKLIPFMQAWLGKRADAKSEVTHD